MPNKTNHINLCVPSRFTPYMSISNDIVSFPHYTFDSILQDIKPPLPSYLPYKLTLSLEELLIPKIKNVGKIPRPLNSWLLFLKDYAAMIKSKPENNKLRIRDMSSMASKSWREQSQQVKQFFEMLSFSAKDAHKLMFPNYKFRPERKYKLRFDKIKSNAAPQIDLQLPLEDSSLACQSQFSDSSSLDGDCSTSPPYDLPSSEDIYYSLLQDNNTEITTNESDEGGISMKEFFELTVSELNNTKHNN